MKIGTPTRLTENLYANIERVIVKMFDDVLYRELFEIIKKDQELYNDTNAIAKAIQEGRITFRDGHFIGNFNATLSKDIKALGGKYDAKNKSYRLSKGQLPVHVISALVVKSERDQRTVDAVIRTIDSTNVNDMTQGELFPEYEKTIRKMDNEIKKSVRGIGIEYKLTDDQLETLAAEWSQNLSLYIQNFTNEQIIKLRSEILEKAKGGQRAEAMVKIIQQEYNVSLNKAKFLARQETSLLMSKTRETRYKGLGLNRYIWRTSNDERVRERHSELNGKIYDWSNPPIVDEHGNRAHPGEDFNCRCVAVPVIEDK